MKKFFLLLWQNVIFSSNSIHKVFINCGAAKVIKSFLFLSCKINVFNFYSFFQPRYKIRMLIRSAFHANFSKNAFFTYWKRKFMCDRSIDFSINERNKKLILHFHQVRIALFEGSKKSKRSTTKNSGEKCHHK
jgi:hypothetical protein